MLYITDFYLLYIIAFTGAILGFTHGQIMISLVLLIYSIAGLIIYLRTGNIRKSLNLFHKGKFKWAAILLMFTFPGLLSPENKAYYKFLKGVVMLGTDNKYALSLIRQALNTGLLREQDRQVAMKILFGQK